MLKEKESKNQFSCFGEPVLVVHLRDLFVVNESVATDSSLLFTYYFELSVLKFGVGVT